jgi:inorganic pyrophosphatase
MICVSEATFPGCLIPVRVIAVFRTKDEAGQDDKMLCVPYEDPNWSQLETLGDLPSQLRVEIEHFFSIYKVPEGKDVEIQGWEDREVAERLLAEARERAVQ